MSDDSETLRITGRLSPDPENIISSPEDLDRAIGRDPKLAKLFEFKPNGPALEARPRAVRLSNLTLCRDAFWAVDGLLPRCEMMLVYGVGGSGKTYLAASLAMGIASGEWFGTEAEPGSVLYCAFERPQDAEDRLASLRDLRELRDLPLGLLGLAGVRMDDEVAELIVEEAKALATDTKRPCRLIVIDTVAAALGGDPEDDKGFGRLRMLGERIAKTTGAMILWIMHEGKADNRGPRGSLTLPDACSVWWFVEVRADGSRVVHVAKANRGPERVPVLGFKLAPFVAGTDVKGKPIELCDVQRIDLDAAMQSPAAGRGWEVTKPKAKAASAPGMGANQKLLLDELRKLAKHHPDGVEEAAAKSAFLNRLAAKRTAAGKPQLNSRAYAAKFLQTLKPLIAAGTVLQDGCVLFLDGGDDDE